MVSDKIRVPARFEQKIPTSIDLLFLLFTMSTSIHTVMKLTFTVNTPDEQPTSLSQKGAHVTSVISILYQ